MLAPFTSGWQSTETHPLVIERSEVEHLVLHVNLLRVTFIVGQSSHSSFSPKFRFPKCVVLFRKLRLSTILV